MTPPPGLFSNREWEHWGRIDPLYAVAAWPGKDLGGAAPWTEGEFRRLGESDFADIVRHWRHYGIAPGRCVEIGCGAGRLTGPLLSAFDTALALDVSPAQILRATRLLGERAQHVTFQVVSGATIPAPDGSCAGMLSTHVFQHLPSFDAVADVGGAHRGAPVGPVRLGLRNTRTRVLRALGFRRFMEYHRYPAARVLRCLESLGFHSPELRVFAMTSNGDAHSFFFARRL